MRPFRPMTRPARAAALALAMAAGLAAQGVTLGGCLAKPGPLDPAVTAGLPAYRRLVKVAVPGGAYRCALEVEGYALKDVLDRLDVKKQVDDGYDRPLDTFVAVTGRDGRRTLLSYCEVFLAGDGGPLLVPRARLLLPHKHDPLDAAGLDRSGCGRRPPGSLRRPLPRRWRYPCRSRWWHWWSWPWSGTCRAAC